MSAGKIESVSFTCYPHQAWLHLAVLSVTPPVSDSLRRQKAAADSETSSNRLRFREREVGQAEHTLAPTPRSREDWSDSKSLLSRRVGGIVHSAPGASLTYAFAYRYFVNSLGFFVFSGEVILASVCRLARWYLLPLIELVGGCSFWF